MCNHNVFLHFYSHYDELMMRIGGSYLLWVCNESEVVLKGEPLVLHYFYATLADLLLLPIL